jgi:hypothetical protein
MTRVASRLALVLAVLLVIGLPNSRMRSCGPFFSSPIYQFTVHPDLPIKDFAAGRTGIVQGTWARSYLTVAYQYLSGGNYNHDAQRELLHVWEERMNVDLGADSGSPAPRENPYDSSAHRRWERLRSSVLKDQDTAAANRQFPFGLPYQERRYQYFENLNENTYATALHTLESLLKKYAPTSPEVRSWIEGEDSIMTPVELGLNVPMLPIGIASNVIRKNRAYQQGAANFYLSRYDTAIAIFRAIAMDDHSPWQATSQYLVARCFERKAQVDSNAFASQDYAQSLKDLDKLEHDPRYASMAEATRDLRSFVSIRVDRVKALHRLSDAVLNPKPDRNLRQDLIDYTSTLDHFLDNGDRYDPHKTSMDSIPKGIFKDDLTDWVVTVNAGDSTSRPHSLTRWRETKSETWLVAAISDRRASEAGVQELMNAALKLPKSSHAYLSARYHCARLLIDAGKRDAARLLLDSILADRSALSLSVTNMFLLLRMEVDGNLKDFLSDAARHPVAIVSDDAWTDGIEGIQDSERIADPKKDRGFSKSVTDILNYAMPLSMLLEAARDQSVPEHLRMDLARAGWTRSWLVKNIPLTIEFATIALGDKKLGEYFKPYLQASEPATQEWEAVNLLVRAPILGPFVDAWDDRDAPLLIESWQRNWWCAWEPERDREANEDNEEDWSHDRKLLMHLNAIPPFLSPDILRQATLEQNLLRAIPPGPNYLAIEAMKWSAAVPNDPRIPAALHRIVLGTRYGCTDSLTSKYSEKIFKLLHKKYGNTKWAKETPYWF